MSKKSIVNCHTHIFTGDHVPPYLAKTFIPFLYWMLHLGVIVGLFRAWYKGPARIFHGSWYKKAQRFFYKTYMFVQRHWPLKVLYWAVGAWLFLQVLFSVFALAYEPVDYPEPLERAKVFLENYHLDQFNRSWQIQFLFALGLFVFFRPLANLVIFLSKLLFKLLRSLPGKQTKELMHRYLNLGRFAFHPSQSSIFQRLRYQYPSGTEFIVLQMDMEYMQAGKVPKNYHKQLDELAKLKAEPKCAPLIHPFMAIDPRRIENDQDFFRYSHTNGRIKLEDCTIKTYIEQKNFAGFKIYPALGYYPFDHRLLPLWKYAEENQIPIMTHCIRGTIFFRGKKEKSWDEHPVFEQAMGNKKYDPLLLPQSKNMDFSVNFTHPLNYLCLLDDTLLAQLLKKPEYKDLAKIFGLEDGQVKNGLKNLKICFAHFGGEDEWKRYFELDRDNYSTQVIKNPKVGITFLKSFEGQPRRGKIEQLWKHCDWYSIICSMMLQFDNIYADISYISHDKAIHALLKRTLQEQNDKLRKRVLFGTDFYVVRNHKSEKEILADTIGGLSEEEFDLIARENPRSYLARRPTSTPITVVQKPS